MKKLLLILLCLPMIGFGQKNLIVAGIDLEHGNFDLKPNIGVFLKENILIGTGLSFSSTFAKTQTINQLNISPYIRFYDKNLFFSLDYSFFQSTVDTSSNDYISRGKYVNLKNAQIGINIGYSKSINEIFYFGPSIRLSYNSHYDNNGVDGYISERPKTIQTSIVLGIQFRL
jgi:hypothetical protein